MRILAELDEPGSTVGQVARRHEVSRGLLWQWRDAQRRGELLDQPAFLPMRVLAAPDAPAAPPTGDAAAEPEPHIEIVLPDGTALRVNKTVGAAVLRRVLAALRR